MGEQWLKSANKTIVKDCLISWKSSREHIIEYKKDQKNTRFSHDINEFQRQNPKMLGTYQHNSQQRSYGLQNIDSQETIYSAFLGALSKVILGILLLTKTHVNL